MTGPLVLEYGVSKFNSNDDMLDLH